MQSQGKQLTFNFQLFLFFVMKVLTEYLNLKRKVNLKKREAREKRKYSQQNPMKVHQGYVCDDFVFVFVFIANNTKFTKNSIEI